MELTTEHIMQQDLVKDWSIKFKQLVNEEPCIASKEDRLLGARLVLEEALELVNALGVKVSVITSDAGFIEIFDIKELEFDAVYTPSLKEIADATADLKWVTIRAELISGIGAKSNDIFKAVYDSNMSKLWTTEDYATAKNAGILKASCIYCNAEIGKCTSPKDIEHARRWLVVDQNNKVVKSPTYRVVQLDNILKI